MLKGCRVLMTADAVGGIWTYALDLGHGLVERGANVTLAVLGPEPDANRHARAEAAGLRLVVTGRRPEWLAEDAAELSITAEAIAKLAREGRADLVHLNHPVLAGLAAYPCPIVGVAHSCLATWWEAVRGTQLPEDFAWRTDLVRNGYRAVDALVAPAQSFAAATQRLYGLDREPMVIHNARPPRHPPERDPPGAMTLSAGRLWDEGKGIAFLDQAALLVDRPIAVAGPVEGPNGARITLRAAIEVGTLSDADMSRAFSDHEIYAAPALYEPFGLSVLEAAQAGCALVLSDIPTFRELWDEAAMFVPPRNSSALADAIDRLASGRRYRDEMGRLAAARAERYGLDRFVQAYAALYADLRAGRYAA